MSVDLKKIAAAFPEFQLSSKSRHDGALLLQLQAADGRYVARTIPSPQLSAPSWRLLLDNWNSGKA
ncbi:hypothetical protein, partial [Pseudomonas aeruginosa]